MPLTKANETDKNTQINGISTIVGYLMPKLSFKKNSSGTI